MCLRIIQITKVQDRILYYIILGSNQFNICGDFSKKIWLSLRLKRCFDMLLACTMNMMNVGYEHDERAHTSGSEIRIEIHWYFQRRSIPKPGAAKMNE